MAVASFVDVCRFTPTAGGTTDWTYSSAVTGYQSPASANAVNAATYRYRAESADLTQWEVGYGVYNSGTGVLTRATVLFNSSGGTSKINFSVAPQVAIVALAEDLSNFLVNSNNLSDVSTAATALGNLNGVSYGTSQGLSSAQQIQGRQNVYAAPFDAFGALGLQINGSMDVSQENVTNTQTMSSGNTIRSVDLFSGIYIHGANTAVFTSQQVAPPGSPSFGACFPNCIQLKSTTALSSPAAGDLAFAYTAIEGYRASRVGFGNANAQSVTIGFWVYATIAGTGTLSLRNSAQNRSYVANFTVSNATMWQYITVTIPGDTSGTWLMTTGAGIIATFAFAAGSTYQGTNATWQAGNFVGTSSTTNFFASNNNVVCLTGVIIIPGTEAPSSARSPFIMRPYDQELILCQRYFRKSFPQATACAQSAGATGAIFVKNPIALGDPSIFVQFNPIMRVAATITTFNPFGSNANWHDYSASADVTVSVDPLGTIGDGGVLIATSGTVSTLGDLLGIHYKADARLT